MPALFPPMFGEQQLRALLRQCEARALIGFGSDASIEKCRALGDSVSVVALDETQRRTLLDADGTAPHEPVDPDEMAVILCSSGTTSRPRA